MDERHAFWLAALIDGEGCIYIRTRPGRTRATVTLSIAQNDRRLLDRAAEFMGCGLIYGGVGPRRQAHQLQVNRQADLCRVLTAIEPHLVIKRERAGTALRVLGAAPVGLAG